MHNNIHIIECDNTKRIYLFATLIVPDVAQTARRLTVIEKKPTALNPVTTQIK